MFILELPVDVNHLPLVGKVGLGAAGLVLLLVAFKVGKFVLKLLLGLLALGLIGAAAWWHFMQ